MPTVDDLQRVNVEVNAIPYEMLLANGEPADVVKDTPDGGQWVCRDFAVRKSVELQQLGMPQSDYSLVICWTEETSAGRERHEVLLVRLDGELWVLDSRYPQIGHPTDPPWTMYLFEHQQIAGTLEWRDASAGLA